MKQNETIIHTIPDGAWEAGTTDESLRSCHRTSQSPSGNGQQSGKPPKDGASVEPLPESSRPRKDGPGGD